MSTWLYLRCIDHDPHLESERESGQHLTDLPRIRHEVANRERTVAEYREWLESDQTDLHTVYFRNHSALFLLAHPKCRLEIWDEYGRQWPITEALRGGESDE